MVMYIYVTGDARREEGGDESSWEVINIPCYYPPSTEDGHTYVTAKRILERKCQLALGVD